MTPLSLYSTTIVPGWSTQSLIVNMKYSLGFFCTFVVFIDEKQPANRNVAKHR